MLGQNKKLPGLLALLLQVGTIKLLFSTFFFTAHLAPLGRPDFIDIGGAREPVVLRSSEASLFAKYIQGLQAAHMQKRTVKESLECNPKSLRVIAS